MTPPPAGAALNDTTVISDTVEIDAPQELVWGCCLL